MDITAWAIGLMELLGGPGTALVIVAEALFPPIPGEILLPFAGVAAASDGQHVLIPLAWTTAGSVIGGLGVYAVGRGLGLRRTRAVIDRLPLLEQGDVDMAVRFFDRWGFPAVVIARYVPMVRTFISIPAGIEKMPVGLFALATGLGSGVWNAVFVIAGYAFGQAGGDALEGFVRIYSVAVAGAGLLTAAGFIARRLRARRRGRFSPPHVPSHSSESGAYGPEPGREQDVESGREQGAERVRDQGTQKSGEQPEREHSEHEQSERSGQPDRQESADRTTRSVRDEPSGTPDSAPRPAPTLKG